MKMSHIVVLVLALAIGLVLGAKRPQTLSDVTLGTVKA